ncbi:non-ribosomal peptide synthetase module [Paenibacillus arenilitoris]|uniref:Non-ribosomal peptide synthetase module n=1 Tax=Paenibacillus arenilitoris TaxID=2772299 RepID=A0A927CPL3_9BACL|nr:non-ribosomal peptide synthetase module [Paenibacillus arenilitoris]MBD2870473.1 non-ribosomal peptide synthetase module [Paenibacillus arenilitoris]
MAKRLATEYVNAKLQLTNEEMAKFIRLFEEQQLRLEVLVLDNGNQELVLEDVAGREEVRLTFERQKDYYVCVLSCRLVGPRLTNAMRKAVSAFRGSAIVNRIYSHYTMIYHYRNGTVEKIVESSQSGDRIVFEFKDTRGQLERVFRSRLIEREIDLINSAVNELLDLRNQAGEAAEIVKIDERLTELTRKLFILEA